LIGVGLEASEVVNFHFGHKIGWGSDSVFRFSGHVDNSFYSELRRK